MNVAAIAAFDSAEHEYNDAWNAPSSTRFELPPANVNRTLKERYRVSPDQTLTRHSLCGSQARSWSDCLIIARYCVRARAPAAHYPGCNKRLRDRA